MDVLRFPPLRPVEQIVLQGTSLCNLDCRYCDLSQESRRASARMPVEWVTELLQQLVSLDLLAPSVSIVWHSGEPLTLAPAYYAAAIDAVLDFVAHRTPTIAVNFDFQTNATLIDDEWCDFFQKFAHVVRLGVSCDGPQNTHDAFRVNWSGRGSFARTQRGMARLDERGIAYNVIAVVTDRTMAAPEKFFEFFLQRRQSMTDFHFNVLASPVRGIDGLGYCNADRDRFRCFYERMLELSQTTSGLGSSLPIRNLSQAVHRLAALDQPDAPAYVRETSAPLRSLNMDALGNLTTFHAGLDIGTHAQRYQDGEGFGLGNLQREPLSEMLESGKFARMRADFASMHRRCEAECEYFGVCAGGFELSQMRALDADPRAPAETVECLIHVKALTDAVVNVLEADAARAAATRRAKPVALKPLSTGRDAAAELRQQHLPMARGAETG